MSERRGILLVRAARLIIEVLPRKLRIKAGLNLVFIFINSLLELIGIAFLIPLLVIILDEKKLVTNVWLQKIYILLGFETNTDFIVFLGVFVLLFTILKNIASIFLLKLQYSFSFSVYTQISASLFNYYSSLGLLKLRDLNSNRIVNYLTSVTVLFSQNVVNSVSGIISEGLVLILFTVALFIYYPMAILLVIALMVPCVGFFFKIVKRRMRVIGEERNLISISQHKLLYEAFHGFVDIEMKNKRSWIFKRFSVLLHAMRHLQIRNTIYMQLPLKFLEIVIVMSMVVVISVGILTKQSMAEIGLLLGVFVVASYRLLPGINRLMNYFLNLRNHEYTFNIVEKAKGQENIESSELVGGQPKVSFEKEISLEGVGFTFDGRREILSGINLTIKKGEIIGIIGKSGSGKSTLLNIILRFYRETKGAIIIDGKESHEVDLASWRSLIGYVPQDVFVFDETLKKNIALGIEDSDVDLRLLKRAIDLAGLTEFVAKLEKGENTVLGERGGKMSGGQKQRLGIARALYGGAQILIFDEATSSLDIETQKEIVNAIQRLRYTDRSLTIVIIAHKYSILEPCARILELSEGAITGEMTYETLRARMAYVD